MTRSTWLEDSRYRDERPKPMNKYGTWYLLHEWKMKVDPQCKRESENPLSKNNDLGSEIFLYKCLDFRLRFLKCKMLVPVQY